MDVTPEISGSTSPIESAAMSLVPMVIACVVILASTATACKNIPAEATAAQFTALDYIEIQQLYARYAWAGDAGDENAWAATFTPDGSFNDRTGTDALRRTVIFARDERKATNWRHWNANLSITPTAEGATGLVYLMMVDISVAPPVILSAGHYQDSLVKTSQGWRFKKRVPYQKPSTPLPKP